MQTCYYPFPAGDDKHRTKEWGIWTTEIGDFIGELCRWRNSAWASPDDRWCCEDTDYPGHPDFRP